MLFVDGTYCDQDWFGFNGHCFMFSTFVGNYFDHEQNCAEYDAHLATILDSHQDTGERWTTNFLNKAVKSKMVNFGTINCLVLFYNNNM